MKFDGSPTWARTRDLRINSPSLYQLSYRGSGDAPSQLFVDNAARILTRLDIMLARGPQPMASSHNRDRATNAARESAKAAAARR